MGNMEGRHQPKEQYQDTRSAGRMSREDSFGGGAHETVIAPDGTSALDMPPPVHETYKTPEPQAAHDAPDHVYDHIEGTPASDDYYSAQRFHVWRDQSGAPLSADYLRETSDEPVTPTGNDKPPKEMRQLSQRGRSLLSPDSSTKPRSYVTNETTPRPNTTQTPLGKRLAAGAIVVLGIAGINGALEYPRQRMSLIDELQETYLGGDNLLGKNTDKGCLDDTPYSDGNISVSGLFTPGDTRITLSSGNEGEPDLTFQPIDTEGHVGPVGDYTNGYIAGQDCT